MNVYLVKFFLDGDEESEVNGFSHDYIRAYTTEGAYRKFAAIYPGAQIISMTCTRATNYRG